MHSEYILIIVITSSLIIYSLFARQFHNFRISGPMFMLASGLVYSYYSYVPDQLNIQLAPFKIFIELTLALILFTDAAKTKLAVLKTSYHYALLLLLLALPFTFIFGTALGTWLFPELSIIFVALLAIISTPTDAALSSSFIDNDAIPEKTREAVNVESGLNDGLAVPIFLLLLTTALNQQEPSFYETLAVTIREIGIAIVIALIATPLFFKLAIYSESHRLYNLDSEAFICVAIAVVIYLITQYFGGSGFFAAFIAGLLFDIKFKNAFKPQRVNNAHALANTCALIIWFIFAHFAYFYLHSGVSLNAILFALLALTIMRMIPVILSFMFTKLAFKQRFLLAWYGPRGLASVVFTLILIQTLKDVPKVVIDSAILTIILSVIFHGISAKSNQNNS
ncbi:cation:proton antiporter domain-containing protein [Pseudoalteromonas piratica]|uniref:Cation/H+ exchanger transmembrane domain-containing protein n=1 Tax=Pseudoalteromonas piratica TaxID=1348114 RepID=A0A0A7EKF7_9GAMM|nr:cation:proton antiporter [Pseudoalteromonas piratica]AIY67140.1 hypothetical protein OM33_18910 [Pseudoalteromonas piratica]